jgi:hypothetical protein
MAVRLPVEALEHDAVIVKAGLAQTGAVIAGMRKTARRMVTQTTVAFMVGPLVLLLERFKRCTRHGRKPIARSALAQEKIRAVPDAEVIPGSRSRVADALRC